MDDERFAHILQDRKLRGAPKFHQKTKIDKRFQSMFDGDQFKVKYKVDKRGRPVRHTWEKDLKRYYDISSESESDDEDNDNSQTQAATSHIEDAKDKEAANSLDVKDKDDKDLSKDVKKKLRNLKVDYARGESNLFSESSSSDDDESDSDVASEDEIEHNWGALDNDADQTEQATYRLAACNMNWDRIRAMDLMVLFNSFVPASGVIKSVTIYPSEFGKQRIQEEEVKGPIELVDNQDDFEDETEEGSKYHMEKLRQYQLNRLKYYYAVIVFDSPETANKVYSECDGMEYESSATKVDLRFVPDDMTFDDEPKEKCENLPEKDKYQPRFFTTTALQQAKVDLTWDETDPDRLEFTQKLQSGKIDNIPDAKLQDYVAMDSEEEDSDEDQEAASNQDQDQDNAIDKYKMLLKEIESKETKKKSDTNMEVSWDRTDFNVSDDDSESEHSYVPSDIDLKDSYFAEEFDKPEFKKNKSENKKEKNEEFDKPEFKKNKSENKKEKNEERDEQDAELELLLMNENDHKRHFDLKKMVAEEKGKGKKRKFKKGKHVEVVADDFQINVDDKRFAALFSSHLYNIDLSDSHFVKTKVMDSLIHGKLSQISSEEATAKRPKIDK